ncbi:TIM-barrel domain-containing protein [Bacillus sp. JJ1566]|uniref:glycoside hydrolase family 31 protein n=1 Tax=Bacillus sp. JJ1566 TaxID=3122961 RepID=UPI002FFFC800
MTKYLNQPVDYKQEFTNIENLYHMGMKVTTFDTAKGEGKIKWEAHNRKRRFSFNQIEIPFEKQEKNWIFPKAYVIEPEASFKLYFYSENTVRFRISTRETELTEKQSIMLVDNVAPKDPAECGWESQQIEDGVIYKSPEGSVEIHFSPWKLIFKDKDGKVLTSTQNIKDTTSLKNDTPIPFSYVNKLTDRRNIMAASFTLSPDEKIFGTGESFTRLNKRGQSIDLYTMDAMGTLSKNMYKPIPFYMSSNGYGMFVHTSTPLTFDFGETYDSNCVIYSGDEEFDFFYFIGEPKKVLSEYTSITGKSPMPPLWSFGLWMSRISYFSEEETRDVANKLREYQIPADVIHLDTGWFEEDWKCNYKFSETRFDNPAKMIKDLDEQGFKVSLWQLPYFTPENELYNEIVENGYAIKSLHGGLPTEDAVLDFTNKDAVNWYKEKIANLLNMGVAAIKADFGEGAPFEGVYSNQTSGLYEHNLYPLRYNKAVSEITKEVHDEHIIWARSAWAGSQRYPIHWGGDAEITDSGMAASLRAGLSLGLSGFTYWSHDMGGFTQESPKDLYSRWLGFGMLTSHSRAHGQPPKEPWEYDEEFVELYRKSANLKYSLMPYIYSQAYISSANGWPMLRTLFFEFNNDPTTWYIEDQYMFGSDLLVAPLFEESRVRKVYLPEGVWVDYQTQEVYEGNKWHTIEAKELPVLVFAKQGAVIPHAQIAQSTSQIDWENVELKVIGEAEEYACDYYAPNSNELGKIIVKAESKEVKTTNINKDIKFSVNK